MAFSKRQMLFIPEVNPSSFVFFFERGSSGTSWSIRDYSLPNRVRTIRPTSRPWTVDDIFLKASHAFNAPAHDTNDLSFWHSYTSDLNEKYKKALSRPSAGGTVVAQPPANISPSSGFPMLNFEHFQLLSKAQDKARVLHSANSEDWMTWNALNLLVLQHPKDWWQRMLAAAMRKNPDLRLPAANQPALSFWRAVMSPEEYQNESRRRMLSSRNPLWETRASSREPVEGSSEIDVVVEAADLVVFIEAKLGSDISMNTTYDPHRNQIIRNIDCLLENAGSRSAAFWMLVRDESPARAYVQLMDEYKSDPSALSRDLPHRSPEKLEAISRNLAILCWSDLYERPAEGSDLLVHNVSNEIERRIQG